MPACDRPQAQPSPPKNEQKTLTELKKHSFTQPHLGTTVQIVFYSHSEAEAVHLSEQCFQRVGEFNRIFSDYIDDSELSQLCQRPINRAHHVSAPLFTVIAKAQEISAKSGGAFDITIGSHSKRWRKRETATSQDQVSHQDLKLDYVNQSITLLKPLQIDLGGIAKGYIADELMLILKNAGIIHAGVIIGGETVLAAAPPEKDGWNIGIEDPERTIIGTLTLANTCLSTSGDSYQFFTQEGERHAHLIDPSTKKSVANRLNVTTIAPSAMEADAWATALRIIPLEKSIPLANQQDHLEALFLPFQKAPIPTDQFPSIKPSKP